MPSRRTTGWYRSIFTFLVATACFAADGEEQQATFDSRAAQGTAHFGFLVLLRAVFILAYAPYALCVVAMLEHTVCRLMQKETPISGF